MLHFIDETRLEVASGKGGDGAISFRREKYIAEGGPDGGDGGRGGDIVFKVQRNLKTFTHLQNKHKFFANDGGRGGKSKSTGANAEPLVIAVPPGSRVRDYSSRELLLDLGTEEGEYLFLEGGRGGRGNWRFRSSTNQAPKFATKGRAGQYREILLELALIADIGFIGLPNAGKSSLLKALTTANPKIAPYPFTTKVPNLGIIKRYDEDLILADIPGIIEGASEGLGLGLRFLKHISRTHALAFLIDVNEVKAGCFELLQQELINYSPELQDKQHLIVATKMDSDDSADQLQYLQQLYPNEKIIAISSFLGLGLEELVNEFWLLKKE